MCRVCHGSVSFRNGIMNLHTSFRGISGPEGLILERQRYKLNDGYDRGCSRIQSPLSDNVVNARSRRPGLDGRPGCARTVGPELLAADLCVYAPPRISI